MILPSDMVISYMIIYIYIYNHNIYIYLYHISTNSVFTIRNGMELLESKHTDEVIFQTCSWIESTQERLLLSMRR